MSQSNLQGSAPPAPPLSPDELEARILSLPGGQPPDAGTLNDLTWRIAEVASDTVRARLIQVAAQHFRMSKRDWRRAVDSARAELLRSAAPSAGVLVRERVPDAPVPEGAVLPPGYDINTESLALVSLSRDEAALVARCPVVIAQKTHLADTDTTRLRVAWRLNGAWRELSEDRGVLADAKKIVSLASRDFPVDSDTARSLVRYISAFEHRNYRILPSKHAVTTCGWHSDPASGEPVFVLGRRCIARSGVSDALAVDPEWGTEDGRILDALRESGTWEEWLEAARPLWDHPKLRLVLYASLAAPLVLPCKAPNGIVDLASRTSHGKTSAAQWAASAWGFPGGPGMPGETGLILPWNSTRVFRERVAALLCDLPLFLDDSQEADRQTLVQTVYDVVNGISRGRGARTGGIQRIARWRTVLISTGELPLSSTGEAGGLKVRAPEIWGQVVPDAVTANYIKQTCADVHGHAGPRQAAAVLVLRDRSLPRRLYVEHRTRLLDAVPKEMRGDFGDRVADLFALLWTSAWIFHSVACRGQWLGQTTSAELGAFMVDQYRQVLGTGELRPVHEAALEKSLAWVAANQGRFAGSPEAEERGRPPSDGWLGVWSVQVREKGPCVAVVPHALERFLRDQGYDPASTLRLWRDDGRLVPDEEGKRLTRLVRFAGGRERCYVIQRMEMPDQDEQLEIRSEDIF